MTKRKKLKRPDCPYCGALGSEHGHIRAVGHRSGYRRWRCTQCSKNFKDDAGQISVELFPAKTVVMGKPVLGWFGGNVWESFLAKSADDVPAGLLGWMPVMLVKRGD